MFCMRSPTRIRHGFGIADKRGGEDSFARDVGFCSKGFAMKDGTILLEVSLAPILLQEENTNPDGYRQRQQDIYPPSSRKFGDGVLYITSCCARPLPPHHPPLLPIKSNGQEKIASRLTSKHCVRSYRSFLLHLI